MSQVLEVEQAVEVMPSVIRVLGEEVVDLPQDLYIPPGALSVFLETFEGPLDLLLYLIKKQNLDILDIPIAKITKQYAQYVELMQDMHIELASEYLVMAAMLAEIKSRLLLPKPERLDDEEVEDPRAELIRRLQEYERFKKAAEDLDELPRLDRDYFVAQASPPTFEKTVEHPDVSLDQVLDAFRDVIKRAKLNADHKITQEVLSIRERMTIVLDKVNSQEFTPFSDFFQAAEGRMAVVVTLIAILELMRQKVLEFVQNEEFAPIYVKSKPIDSEG